MPTTPIAIFASPKMPLAQVTAALGGEDVEAVPFVLSERPEDERPAAGFAKCALIVSEQGVLSVGEQVSRVRDLVGPGARLILCTQQPTGGHRRTLMECGASEIISPQTWVPGHIAERLLSQLILEGDVQPSSSSLLWGGTKKIRALYEHIARVAPLSEPVLILGETGTGKDLVAREIHALSGRPDIYVAINCPEISVELIGSELFGHERGAFTGADRSRSGLIAEAGLGTVFLDEIGDLDLQAQAKLLRVIEDRKVRRVGANQWDEVKARIILATNRGLENDCRTGRFRSDLYERIRGFTLHVPPLRERKSDIPLLVNHFLSQYNSEYGTNLKVPPGGVDSLFRHTWPGNVRELRAVVRRAAAYADGSYVSSVILQEAARRPGVVPNGNVITFDPATDSWRALSQRAQIAYFRALLELTGNSKEAAVKLSGLSRSQFYEKLREVQRAADSFGDDAGGGDS